MGFTATRSLIMYYDPATTNVKLSSTAYFDEYNTILENGKLSPGSEIPQQSLSSNLLLEVLATPLAVVNFRTDVISIVEEGLHRGRRLTRCRSVIVVERRPAAEEGKEDATAQAMHAADMTTTAAAVATEGAQAAVCSRCHHLS